MRVRQFELRLIAIALLVAWAIAASLVLVAYRPGGPFDLVVGATSLLPIAIAGASLAWPPVARGSGAFPLMVALGLGALLLLLPSIAGVYDQLQAHGAQTLLPSLEAAYPWFLALAGTSLFAGFGIARRALGGSALRPRRLIAGIGIGSVLTLLTAASFAGVAVANEFALNDQPGSAAGSRFGPTDVGGQPPPCDGDVSAGPSARVSTRLAGTIDLRSIGSVDQGGVRDGDDFRWLAYVATDRELGWYGATTLDERSWTRVPDHGWQRVASDLVADRTVDLRAIEVALTPGFRATAEDRGVEVIERAPARRCRIAVDGDAFLEAFPQARWLVGDADLGDWRGQLDFWIFLDGQVGQISGNLSGEGFEVEPDALQGSIDVTLTATQRDRDVVIYPPGP
ncbi:MAG: hypothetical protein OEV61_00310 [Chloroflexota bacterium]|nr:hypothetical protein [Chloroflexota bacterium]MDH5242956.1 hypothetical protein [Chloroflexota bacterium]